VHNKYRGEISAEFDGRPYRLCLTLGALAELEAVFGNEDMIALATRFENGRLKAGDAIKVIGAGLRGAGTDISDADVSTMRCSGGAAGYVSVVVNLLEATFGASGEAERDEAPDQTRAPSREEGPPLPFPGTM
jgi:hypothetical protein